MRIMLPSSQKVSAEKGCFEGTVWCLANIRRLWLVPGIGGEEVSWPSTEDRLRIDAFQDGVCDYGALRKSGLFLSRMAFSGAKMNQDDRKVPWSSLTRYQVVQNENIPKMIMSR